MPLAFLPSRNAAKFSNVNEPKSRIYIGKNCNIGIDQKCHKAVPASAPWATNNRISPLQWFICPRSQGRFIGLYSEHVTIVNDASRVVSEWINNLENHSSVINYDPRGVIYTHLWYLWYKCHLWQTSMGDRNMFIVQATDLQLKMAFLMTSAS